MGRPVAPPCHSGAAPAAPAGDDDLPGRFRRVYYHLYANSNTSRAEALLADLSLLLLVKLAAEVKPDCAEVDTFVAGEVSAAALLPGLRAAYPGLVAGADRFRLDDAALRHALAELTPVRLAQSPAHVLGEAFQALLGPRIRGDRGQFFTPRALVRAIVQIVAPRAEEAILDPACGTGGFLHEARAYLQARDERPAAIHGADKDRELARLAASLLAFHTEAGVVANINSLDTQLWASAGLRDRYDVILTNPPFGTKIPVRDEEILAGYELARQWRFDDRTRRWRPTDARVSGRDPQLLFLELCVRTLRPGGRMAIVLPEGVFGNKQEAYVWDWVRAQGEILALLDCPRTTFQPGTDTKTNVLFFRRAGREERAKTRAAATVPVAVALRCGHDRRGRTVRVDGTPYPDDFAALARGIAFDGARMQPRDRSWHAATITDPYYLVPRYYVDEAPVSAAEAAALAGAPWRTLGELRDAGLLAIRKGHEVGSEAYGTGEVPFVRTSDVANFEISPDPTRAVSEEIYAEYAPQQRLRPGAILMVVDGRYRIGQAALLTARTARCVVQSHLRILDAPRPEVLDPYALLFALALPGVRRRIRDLVFIQSTLGTLGARLLELRIPLLQGQGPWTATLRRFREALEQRDRMLAVLGEIAGPEVEL